MNCCDYKCHQGRNCPVRSTVTKVRQRYPDADPLPPSTWRQYLPDLARFMLTCVAVSLCMAAFVGVLA